MIELDNLKELKRKLKIEEYGPAQSFFVAECYRRMTDYVPMDKNVLRRIVFLDSDSITYMSPYASYQYYGMREDGTHVVQHYTTPGTGPYWDIQMMNNEGQQVVDAVQRFIER